MNKRRWLAGFASAAMALSMFGCSSSDSSSSTTTTDDSTAAAEDTSSSSSSDWNLFFMAVSFTGLDNTGMNNMLGYQTVDGKTVIGSQNYARIEDAELNGYLEAGKKTGDEEVSLENYKKAMVRESELVPFLAIYGNELFNVYNKRVQNLKTGTVANWSQCMAGASLDSSVNSPNGDTFVVGTTQELSGVFSPLYADSAYDMWVVNMIYQSMTAYNADDEIVPQAAESMPEYSEDGKTITFKLREGQKFSNGDDLTASDVYFTFKLLADPQYVGQLQDGVYNFIEGWADYQNASSDEISGIKVIDDYTISFTCAEADIDAASTIGTMAIMDEDQFAYSQGDMGEYATQTTDVIGSGPYALNKYDKSAGASVILNENYTGDGEYNIKQVIVRTIGSGTEVASLQSGEIDYLSDQIDSGIVGPASLLDNVATSHHFRAAEGYFGFNCADGPTADPAVRQALAYATNRQEFADAYFQWPKANGEDQVASDIKDVELGYVPAAFWSPVARGTGDITTGKETLEGLVEYSYDIEKAKQILDDAGWTVGSDGIREKDGEKLLIKMLATENNSVLDMLIPIMTKSFDELGVDFKPVTIDFNSMTDIVDPTNE